MTILFDPAFYRAQAEGLPDVPEADAALLDHYRVVGWPLLLDPHPLFSTALYLAAHDLPPNTDPITHYLAQITGTRPVSAPVSPWFDALAYTARYPDVLAARLDPLLHFIEYGDAERRSAGPRADAALRRDPGYDRPGGVTSYARTERESSAAWFRSLHHASPTLRAEALAAIPDPLVSLLMPPHQSGAEATLRSLQAQAYPHWELCAVPHPATAAVLHTIAVAEPRLRVLPQAARGTAANADAEAAALNAALVAAQGSWTAVIDPGDTLHPLALATLLRHAATHDAAYADEARITPSYASASPHRTSLRIDQLHRPAWSPELLLSDQLLARATLVRTALLRAAGGFPPGCGRAAALGLMLRVLPVLPPWRIAHLPYPLILRGPAAPSRPADNARAVAAATLHATVAPHQADSRVSVIVTTAPTTIPGPQGPVSLLDACVQALRHRTAWPLEDILIRPATPLLPSQAATLEAAGARLLPPGTPLAAAVAATASPDAAPWILLLDDGLTPLSPDWLEFLLGAARRPGVAIAGPRLLFPDGRIRHAGLTLVAGLPASPFFAAPAGTPHQAGVPDTLRTCQAVATACLLISRTAWDAASGADDALPHILAGPDLCLRLAQRGLRTLYVPAATLIDASPLPPDLAPEAAAPFRAHWAATEDPYIPLELRSDPPLGTYSLFDTRAVPGAQPPAALEAWTAGLTWFGPVNRSSGLGTAARNTVAACAGAGLKVRAVPLDALFAHQPEVSGPPAGPLQAFPVIVLQANADTVPALRAHSPGILLGSQYRIAAWVWELPEAPPEWRAAAAPFDEIWVPSAFCAQAARAVTSRPVTVIPYPIPPRPALTPAIRRAARKAFGIPQGVFTVLYAFDTYSFVARKNPAALLDAFEAEFGTDPRALLILKVTAAHHLQANSWPENEALARRLADPPANVRILTETLPDQGLVRLMQAADCYASPHRSEGFGLTVAEAMATGLPTVATSFGAPAEFVLPGAALPLDHTPTTLPEARGPYAAGQSWAEPSIPHLRSLLRQLAGDPTLRTTLGQAAQALIAQRFAPVTVGQLIRRRLSAIAAGQGGWPTPISSSSSKDTVPHPPRRMGKASKSRPRTKPS